MNYRRLEESDSLPKTFGRFRTSIFFIKAEMAVGSKIG